MKKILLERILLGGVIGIAFGHVITIIISLMIGGGEYYPSVPETIGAASSEINAVMLQTVLCGVIGSSFSATEVIWKLDHWSILKQSGIYIAINSLVMMPIAYTLNWLERSVIGVISYFGIFLLIFILAWLIQYFRIKAEIKKINEKIK